MRIRSISLLASLAIACGSGGTPAPAGPDEPMPLPPSRDEIEGKVPSTDDGQLRVIAITPNQGPAAGGNAVQISGANFRTAGSVKVRFKKADADVLRVSDDEIAVQVPPGSAGELVDVTVIFEHGGELELRGAYTYAADGP